MPDNEEGAARNRNEREWKRGQGDSDRWRRVRPSLISKVTFYNRREWGSWMKGDPVDHPPVGFKSRSASNALLPIPAEMTWIVCIKLQHPEVFRGFNIQAVLLKMTPRHSFLTNEDIAVTTGIRACDLKRGHGFRGTRAGGDLSNVISCSWLHDTVPNAAGWK